MYTEYYFFSPFSSQWYIHIYLRHVWKIVFPPSFACKRRVALLFSFLPSVNRSEIRDKGPVIRDEVRPVSKARLKDDNPTRTAVGLNWIRSRRRRGEEGGLLLPPPLPRLSLRSCPYVSYFENRMITRLRSRHPALPAPASVKSKVNIYYRERFRGGTLQRGRSRVSYLTRGGGGEAETREEGSRTKKENRSRRSAFTIWKGCVGGRCAHTHTSIAAYTRGVLQRGNVLCCAEERFRVGVIRIRNLFLPRGSTTTSSYILLFPRAIPSIHLSSIRSGPDVQATSSIESPSCIYPRCQVLSRWLHTIFQDFIALSPRTSRVPFETPADCNPHTRSVCCAKMWM